MRLIDKLIRGYVTMLSAVNPQLASNSNIGLFATEMLNKTSESLYHLPLPRSAKQKKNLSSLELLEKYTESRIRFKPPSKKCILQDHGVMKNALELFPFNDMNEIDRENAEWLRNVLYLLPKNFRKQRCFDGLVGIEVIQANSTLKKATLAPLSVKGIIQKLSTFCNWAVAHGYIETNVFRSLPTLPQRSEDERQPFTPEDLNLVFNISDYVKHQYHHPYYYWLPLMMRYTGARMNEICQLRTSEVVITADIPYLKIRELHADQTLKTSYSFRFVPIHSELIRLGFLDFVATRQHERLFPELKRYNGYYSHYASKWFKYRRDKIGLGKGKDGHSFRHNFVNELKQNLVSREVIECLVGHAHRSDSFNVYSKQYGVEVLKSFIEQIDTSNTSHLKPYFE